MIKKNTGSYYTPNYLAKFVVSRVLNHLKDKKQLSLLEPSVGDGIFLNTIKNTKYFEESPIQLTAVDINTKELLKAKLAWNDPTATFIEQDFLDYESKQKFSVVIGNPPYIRKNLLDAEQLRKCQEIHFSESLEEKSIKNIWTSFVIKSNKFLKRDGVLAFVLPAELLQVKFTEEIRKFLQNKFQRLEIFTFNDLMFECKGQDTVVLVAYKKHSETGVFYSNIENESQLKKGVFQLQKNDSLISSSIKWSHHLLTSPEIDFIENLRNKLNIISSFCNTKPGIVTAANDYFIINEKIEKQYELSKYTASIIQKGLFVNGSVVFDENDYKELVESKYPTKILIFNDEDKEEFSEKVKEYIKLGEDRELHKRYKCNLRDNWFVIPNISTKPEGFFFKRSHLYPKILKNSGDVFVTDSAYKIEMKEGFNINSLIYSFYNSLTLTFAEIEGRYYGGGVLELTPSEFKRLPIPYLEINDKNFNKYRQKFENKQDIQDILELNDFKILNKKLNLTQEEILKVQKIRQKLVNKRLRRN